MTIVACHVLHRLQKPRHPLCALIAFLSPWLTPTDIVSRYFAVCQRTFALIAPIAPGSVVWIPFGGEYRSRTDGLLRARQAL